MPQDYELSARFPHLTLGGQHDRRLEGDDLPRAIELAIAAGVRFFDTANAYGQDSLSERPYGQHLTPKDRDEIFLMTKSASREPQSAQKHLEGFLRNLQTVVLDLWQVHTLVSIADVDRRWDNGTIDLFLKAREEGKVRHLGFTDHKQPEVHLHMLKRLQERGISFQACQFPVNVCDPAYSSFIEKVLPVCLERKIGVLAMKTMCVGTGEGWGPRGKVETQSVVPELVTFRDATDYVWSLPISTRIADDDTLKQLEENIATAQAIAQLSPQQQNEILTAAATAAGPEREYYKRNLLAQADPEESKF